MDKDFEFLMTTAFKDLTITTNGDQFEVERVFGSPGKEFPKKGVLMEVSLAYPSEKENSQLTKGGIVIIKLKSGQSNSEMKPLELKVTYKDRKGKVFTQEQTFQFPQISNDQDFWQVKKKIINFFLILLIKN